MTKVVDRKAVQQRGQQILDSLIVANDDKVVKAAVAEMRVGLENLTRNNSVTVDRLAKMVETAQKIISKDQADITRFGFEALEKARIELRDLAAKGDLVLHLADETVGKAMSMAERVAQDQAKNQAQALEILSSVQTADYSDTLKHLTTMTMGFALLALVIVRKG
jgi:hypothetical protein